jgi:3-dehydroquinate dehydratase-2
MKIIIINGVNMNAVGYREPEIYGYSSFEDYLCSLRLRFPDLQIDYFQSNHLEDLVDTLYKSKHYDGIILNPGAYTHTSIVLADTIKALNVKTIEVHISNLFGREAYRRNSFISATCQGFISGFGLKSYELAIYSFLN